MLNNRPTQPDLSALKAGTASGWPEPPEWPMPVEQEQPIEHRATFWPALLLAAVLFFGAGSGVTVLLLHGNTSGGHSVGGPAPHPSATHAPTSSPTPTATSPATVPPQPTATNGGGD
jgi:hypothetical protein